MKKILLTLLAIILITPLIGAFEIEEVEAEEYYSYACSYDQYEVDYINDDGSFAYKGCYSNFDEAKSQMKALGNDYVVRHKSSLSPTKIVAMNSGLVYTYPGRSGTNTMNIYQDASIRKSTYKQTYVSNHYEMKYVDTERYLPQYNGGIVQVVLNGFEGYTDIEYTDLVPDKYLDKGIALYLGGNDNYKGESAFLVSPKRNYYEAVQNGNYLDLAFHYSRAYPEKGNSPTQYTIYVGKAPSFMKTGIRYYSSDGVNFYTDTNETNLAGTYYNYYQYLPLRSKTNISSETLEKYLAANSKNSVLVGHCADFINEQNTYGINGLLLYAMACHESSYGTSGYAKDRNNLFGWNAYDSSPNSASRFNSVTDCINEQAGINLRGYIDITDGRFYSSSLGNKGSGINVKYASDPYWSLKIASIAYKIDKYSKGNDGTYTDYNSYTLANINTFDVPIKASASDSSKTLYTTQYGPYYQKDFIVIVLESGNEYTKIQSTNAIDSNGNIKTHRTPITTGTLNPISEYNFDTSVAYIKTSYLNMLDGSSNTIQEKVDSELSFMSSVDSVSISNNNLNISGCGFIKGMSFNNLNNITHTITLKKISDNSVYKTYKANSKSYPGIKFNDGHTYDYVGFEIALPLSEIQTGDYYLTIKVDNGSYSYESKLLNYIDETSNLSTIINGINYHIISNSIYSNRMEITVESIPNTIDYSSINKPSLRNSLFSFDQFTLDDSGNMYMYGQSMIYYCHYNNKADIKYTIYLVDSKDNYIEIACNTMNSNADYKKLLNSSFNMDYICFEANKNISTLNAGNYKMIMKVVNGSNIDIYEMTNAALLDTPSKTINGKTFKFYTSNVHDRMMLEVK